ncbi:MAG: type II toxin-antitoxin system RelE/ParE family toxin [Oscillospiraceae bacterium]|nr:type II toxin-antitoxin system RelE/ParE family toxin [Oscillospiraceae bacterium]
MKYTVKTLDAAFRDLKEIKTALSRFYPGTARRFITQYKRKATRLKEMPYAYERYTDDMDYRRMIVNEYLVFYVVNDEAKTVEIHRVLHGSMDLSKHLSFIGRHGGNDLG